MNQTHTFCDTLISTSNPLKRLGWKPFFQQQLTLDDYDDTIFARVIAITEVVTYWRQKRGKFTSMPINLYPI